MQEDNKKSDGFRWVLLTFEKQVKTLLFFK